MERDQASSGSTKKCPKCGEMIQISAKRCKHCQADLRNWFLRHKISTGLLGLLAVIIIMGILASQDEKASVPIPASSNSDPDRTDNSNSNSKLKLLDNNNPTVKQLGTLTADYVGKSFVLNVNAETSDYYNYSFDDATKYYSLQIWDGSVGGDYDGIYAYVIKNDTNKQLVNALLDSKAQLEINASIPTTKWESGSNAFLQIDSWKLMQ